MATPRLALALAVLAVVCLVVHAELTRRGLACLKARLSVYDWLLVGSLLGAVASIVVGNRAIASIDQREGERSGIATAKASKYIGIATLVAALFVPSLGGMLEAPLARKHSRVLSDSRRLAAAIEAYRTDTGAYPAWATGSESINGARFEHPDLRRLPSFRITDDIQRLKTLTTPVAYIHEYPADPFSPRRRATFAYSANKYGAAEGWMLVSPGPDRDYDIDPARVYDPSTIQPTPRLLGFTYDPTNGTVSNGDIWRVKQ